MKIVAIRIKNLASLEGTTEIDFTQEPLCSAGIFAITGPTGAGKSTILDTLCLALYAQTPRYDKAKDPNQSITDISGNSITQSDPRGILRDGTAEGFAEVEFIGIDKQHYRATWTVKRARNKAEGNLQPYTIALKNLSTQTDIPGTKTEILTKITQVVGLSFEQFTRAVLLAQGDFTAFLKAAKDEKADLLEKLTGTEIYSRISKRVFEKHRDENDELKLLNVRKEGIVLLQPEEIEEFTNRKTELAPAIQAKEKELAELNKEISWHEQLAVLQATMATANENLEQAQLSKINTAERKQKLMQAEQVQEARPFVSGLQAAEQELNAKKTALDLLNNTLNQQQEEQKAVTALLETATEHAKTQNKNREEAQPQLNEARKLDVQLKERETQVQQAVEEVKAANTSLQEQQKQAKEQEEKAAALQQSIAQISDWKEQNKERQPIADNHSLIVSKLSDAQKFLASLQSLDAQILSVQEQVQQKEEEKIKAGELFISLQSKQAENRTNYEARQQEIALVNAEALEKDRSATDALVQETVQAAADWKIFHNSLQAYETDKATLAKHTADLSANTTQLAAALQQFETVKTQKETSQRSLEIARMAAAENVEALRAQLTQDEPCPVCGSTEHPYATHNPGLDKVLSHLQAEHDKLETAYTASLQQHSTLSEAARQFQNAVESLSALLIQKEEQVNQQQQNWQQFSLYQHCKTLNSEEISTFLQEQIKIQQAQQEKIKAQLQDYYTRKKQTEQQREALEQGEKQVTATDNSIKDLERELQSLKEKGSQYQREQEQVQTSLAEVQKALNPYFTVAAWFEQWKNKPEHFINSIAQFATTWIANSKQLEENTGRHSVLSARLNALHEQNKTLQQEAAKKESTLSGLHQQLQQLSQQRQMLFNGQALSHVEAALQQAINSAALASDEAKTRLETANTALTRTLTQQEETEKGLAKLQTETAAFTEKITQWLQSYNSANTPALSQTELYELLALTPEWRSTERKALQQIEEALIQAETILKERQSALDKHRQQSPSGRDLEQVNTLLHTAKETLQQFTTENTEIAYRLLQDTENRQRSAELLQTIQAKESVVNNWAMLNMVIGSADGKKFRQVAQEYTLDVLLGYANVQLEILSKRYLLQRIPNSLALQVTDQDMGNEIRTVNSLSGGESFLVSLALALGLASLSSSKMQVESLFIDEGFGSLDPNTLNIAMDALERLHNQGRKVGVISHVQEMTERIPVQIKVSKQNGGKSKVEVIGM